MGNSTTSNETNFEINFIITSGIELGKAIETIGEGSIESNFGPKIDTIVYENECVYNEKSKEGYRITNGKKVKGNAKLMKQSYENRKKREKSKGNMR